MLSDIIAEDINKNIPPEKNILISFSGGPDSVYLTHCLFKCRNIRHLTLIYFNHQLQKNSLDELKFAKEFSNKLKIRLIIKKLPIKEHSKRYKISLEESGHICRKRMIEHLCRCLNIKYVCTGHHKDDHLENKFLALIKGTAINFGKLEKYKKNEQDIILCKPLLEFTKDQIKHELKNLNLKYHIDLSNFDNNFNRNLLRNSIIPEIKKINHNVFKTLHHLHDHVYSYTNYLDDINQELFNKIFYKSNTVSICKETFLNSPEIIQKRLIYKMYTNLASKQHQQVRGLKDAIVKIGKKHINAILIFIKQSKNGSILQLSKNLNASIEKNNILLWVKKKHLPIKYKLNHKAGKFHLKSLDQNIYWNIVKKSTFKIPDNKSEHYVNIKKNNLANLYIRPLNKEDLFHPFKQHYKKNVIKYLKKNNILNVK